jgi:lysozyme
MDINKLTADLKSDEGFVPHAYQDTMGLWTIGYGTLIDKRRGGRISQAAAEFMLSEAINAKWAELTKALPWLKNHPEHVQRALANMAYQMGVPGLLRFKTTLSLVEQKRYNEAATQAMTSLWAKQTPKRAERVTDLLRGITK